MQQSENQHYMVLQDPDDVILDFAESRVLDHSALEAVNHKSIVMPTSLADLA